MSKNKHGIYYIAAIATSVIIGVTFIIVKIGLRYSDLLDFLAYRFTFAFLAVIVSVLFGFIKPNINKESIKAIVPLALFFPLLFFTFQALGLQLIQSSEAGIIFAMGPVFTMIIASFFLDEKTSIIQKISILLSVFGVLYIAFKKGSTLEAQNIKGLLFTVISVLTFSSYNVMARKLTRKYSSKDIIVIITAIGFIVFNGVAIGKHMLDGDVSRFFIPLENWEFVLSIAFLGVFSTFTTSFLTVFALSGLESYKISVFSNLSTVISIVAGIAILNESIYYYHIIGSILIIGGVIGANIFNQKEKNRSRIY
jgi:drug/metabolite transporter (DMT)-like permease